MLITTRVLFSITMSETGNTVEGSIQNVVDELSQIKDPEFYNALMEKLKNLSLHKKSFVHEDLDQLFRLAFSYAHTSLKKELGEEEQSIRN